MKSLQSESLRVSYENKNNVLHFAWLSNIVLVAKGNSIKIKKL